MSSWVNKPFVLSLCVQGVGLFVQASVFFFTNVSWALQNILSKCVCCENRTSYEHFKLKLCSCAQSMALGTRTKFQLEFLTINVITGIVYFREIILESSRNVSETTPWPWWWTSLHTARFKIPCVVQCISRKYRCRAWIDKIISSTLMI